MMVKLSTQRFLRHDSYTPYYTQANGQMKAINNFLTNMIKWIVGIYKGNWHSILFSVLWAYHTTLKTSTSFTPFQLVYGLEAILPIKCEIPSLKLAIKLLPSTSADEEFFVLLASLNENHHDVALAIEAHKK